MSDIERKIKRKIEEIGIPLKEWDIHIYRGILTGLNEAFIINSATKDSLIAADPKSAEIIRPILRGRDIKRYLYSFADLWLIATFPSMGYDINEYPAIKEYLLSFGIERIEQSGKTYVIDGREVKARKKTNNKWFETQDSICYWDDFSKQKIVWGEISDKPKFALDEKGQYVTDVSTFFMVGESLLYLFGVLNSKVSQYYFSQFGTTTGVGTVRWKKFKIEQLPIPRISELDKKKFTALVGEIVKGSEQGDDVSELVSRVDDLVYNLIGLSKDEITVIEQYCSR